MYITDVKIGNESYTVEYSVESGLFYAECGTYPYIILEAKTVADLEDRLHGYSRVVHGERVDIVISGDDGRYQKIQAYKHSNSYFYPDGTLIFGTDILSVDAIPELDDYQQRYDEYALRRYQEENALYEEIQRIIDTYTIRSYLK